MTTGRKHDPLFTPGTPIPLEDMRAIGDAAMASSLADGLGGPAQSMAGNYLVDPMARVAFWARLTAESVPYYSFKEVWWSGTTWIDREQGITGTLNARELNSTSGIPVGDDTGQVVWMVTSDALSEAGSPYLFTFPDSSAVSGDGNGPTWYTEYEHLDTPTVNVGDILTPGQSLGVLVSFSGGAHLHFGLGDGQDLGVTDGGGIVSVVGQTQEVADWFPFSYTGTRDGGALTATRSTAFSAAQLAYIRARTGSPIGSVSGWVALLGSAAHGGYEYYAMDLNTTPLASEADIGATVYNACTGTDVKTVVIRKEAVADGWLVVLMHNGRDANDFYFPTYVTWATGVVNVVSGDWTFGGDVSVTYNGPVTICGWMFWCFDDITLGSSLTNDLSISTTKATVYRLTMSADAALSGIVSGGDGHVIALTNVSAYDLTLNHEDAGSSAANRFNLPDDEDLLIPPNGSAVLWYDITTQRHTVLACTARKLTVKEYDGSPSYDSIVSLEFDQDTGLTVTQPAAGRAKVSGGVTVKESDGSPSYTGIASIEFDQASGLVVTQPGANRAKISAGITVKESDGSPSYATVASLEFDQADGFTVSQPGANRAKVNFTASAAGITVKESDGSPSYSSVTSLEFDQVKGFVVTQPGAGQAKVSLPDLLKSGTGGWIHGTGLVDGGGISGVATQNGDTINLSDTGVTPGTYTFGSKSVTVDAQGRITNIV